MTKPAPLDDRQDTAAPDPRSGLQQRLRAHDAEVARKTDTPPEQLK